MRKLNTQDVFKLARLIKKANLKSEIKNIFEKVSHIEAVKADADDTNDKQKEFGIEATLMLIEKIADESVENELYSLLSGIAEKTPDDVKNMSLESVIELFAQIGKENNIMVFFKAAYRSAKK